MRSTRTGLPGRERAVQPGGDGTPEVADFCPAELGCSLQMTAGSAARLIADALDLRHRLPQTWAAARAGRVPAYQARRIATTTRQLTLEQARQVDTRVAPTLGAVSYGRLQDAAGRPDLRRRPGRSRRGRGAGGAGTVRPVGPRQRARVAAHLAKMAAGDAAWGDALITRLAEILQRDGDLDCLDVRRSKALGMLLSQPAEALRLLNSHQNDDDDPAQSPEPDELEHLRPVRTVP